MPIVNILRSSPQYRRVAPSYQPTELECKELLDLFNHADSYVFGNALKRNNVSLQLNSPNKSWYGVWRSKTRSITLYLNIPDQKQRRLTLIHEMVHAYSWVLQGEQKGIRHGHDTWFWTKYGIAIAMLNMSTVLRDDVDFTLSESNDETD